jgi:hypothetical protein
VAGVKQPLMSPRHRLIELPQLVHLHELLDAGLHRGFADEFSQFLLAISFRPLFARLFYSFARWMTPRVHGLFFCCDLRPIFLADDVANHTDFLFW